MPQLSSSSMDLTDVSGWRSWTLAFGGNSCSVISPLRRTCTRQTFACRCAPGTWGQMTHWQAWGQTAMTRSPSLLTSGEDLPGRPPWWLAITGVRPAILTTPSSSATVRMSNLSKRGSNLEARRNCDEKLACPPEDFMRPCPRGAPRHQPTPLSTVIALAPCPSPIIARRLVPLPSSSFAAPTAEPGWRSSDSISLAETLYATLLTGKESIRPAFALW